MTTIEIFGNSYNLAEQISDKDQVQLMNQQIEVQSHSKPSKTLLKESLEDTLHEKLLEIYKDIESEGTISIFGKLDFEIKERIDGKKNRIAKLKGNRIIVKLDAVALPEDLLRYVVAHEMAHTLTKRHTDRFWRIVKIIQPNYEEAQEALKRLIVLD